MVYTFLTPLHRTYIRHYIRKELEVCIDNYIRIVEEMLARNERVTLEGVRKAAGRGSYSTISEAIKVVLNRGLVPAEVTGPVPESLIEEAKRVWHEACKLASSTVGSERLALHSVRVELQEGHRELTALADSLAKQVDELTAELGGTKAERDALADRAVTAEANLKVVRQVIKDLGLKLPGKAGVEKGQTTEET